MGMMPDHWDKAHKMCVFLNKAHYQSPVGLKGAWELLDPYFDPRLETRALQSPTGEGSVLDVIREILIFSAIVGKDDTVKCISAMMLDLPGAIGIKAIKSAREHVVRSLVEDGLVQEVASNALELFNKLGGEAPRFSESFKTLLDMGMADQHGTSLAVLNNALGFNATAIRWVRSLQTPVRALNRIRKQLYEHDA